MDEASVNVLKWINWSYDIGLLLKLLLFIFTVKLQHLSAFNKTQQRKKAQIHFFIYQNFEHYVASQLFSTSVSLIFFEL